jgi:molecular chaperone IbpA
MKISHSDYNDPWDNHRKNPYDPYGKAVPMPSPHDPWDKKDKWPKPPAPKVITINDLFPSLDRWAIGWSPLLEQLKELSTVKASYPPYDIIDHKNDTTVINVAVAGFDKKELSITVEEQTLKIEGKKKDKDQEGEIVHNGIAGRDFKLTFALAEFYEVESAKVENGLLSVKLFKNIPDEKKPKVIDIK